MLTTPQNQFRRSLAAPGSLASALRLAIAPSRRLPMRIRCLLLVVSLPAPTAAGVSAEMARLPQGGTLATTAPPLPSSSSSLSAGAATAWTRTESFATCARVARLAATCSTINDRQTASQAALNPSDVGANVGRAITHTRGCHLKLVCLAAYVVDGGLCSRCKLLHVGIHLRRRTPPWSGGRPVMAVAALRGGCTAETAAHCICRQGIAY